MEWLIEELDQDVRPLSSEDAGVAASSDRLDALIEAVTRTETVVATAEGSAFGGKAATLRAILRNVRDSIDNALRLLDDMPPVSSAASDAAPAMPAWNVMAIPLIPPSGAPARGTETDRIVEGVFDGRDMIGDDGKSYIVPPNYASKSKLVEGDMLKLTIGARGNFIYKQIGPIERQRLIGTLAFDQETGQFLTVAGGRSWKIIKASVTYYKAEAGDEAVILVPKNAPSKWAAVENIIKKTPTGL